MPERPEALVLNELPTENVAAMANYIFTHRLGTDVKHLWSQDHSPAFLEKDSLGAQHPGLQALQKDLLNDGTSNEAAVQTATDLYLELRAELLSGQRDEYGRAPWLNTVPTELDSAAASVISHLEGSDENLIDQGPLYRVFDSKYKPGRFDVSNIFFQDHYTPDTETPAIAGKKIMVPSSAYSGYYAAIFVPDVGGNVFLWSSSHNSRPTSDNFRAEVAGAFDEIKRTGHYGVEDWAKLYAVKMYCDLYGDDRVKGIFRDVLSNDIGVPAPTDTDFDNLWENLGRFPEHFKPASDNSLDLLKKRHSHAVEVITEGKLDILVPYSALIAPREVMDPGYTTLAIDALTRPDTYKKWLDHCKDYLARSLRAAHTLESPTLFDVNFHSERYYNLSRMGNIDIPWQAEFILGQDGYADLQDRIRKIGGTLLDVSLLGEMDRDNLKSDNVRNQLAQYGAWVSQSRANLAASDEA